jgi:SM-20-related protein
MTTKPDEEHRFDLYTVREFFDAETCRGIIDEMRRSPVRPAVVYGQGGSGSVDERVRKVARLAPAPETVELVTRRLLECRGEVGEHFGISLGGCEEPQFLRYLVGDFFVAHQDGNTGLLLSERERRRKVSVVVFLNRQSEAPEAEAYCGGSLVFSDWRGGRGRSEFRFHGEAGTLVAFRAETTHEVIPVTHGERHSIVSWYG